MFIMSLVDVNPPEHYVLYKKYRFLWVSLSSDIKWTFLHWRPIMNLHTFLTSFQASGFMSQRSPCSLICPIRWKASWLEPGPPPIILHWLSSNVLIQERLWGQKPIKCYPFSFIHYYFCYVIHFYFRRLSVKMCKLCIKIILWKT